jgi:hypothetical protein
MSTTAITLEMREYGKSEGKGQQAQRPLGFTHLQVLQGQSGFLLCRS